MSLGMDGGEESKKKIVKNLRDLIHFVNFEHSCGLCNL